ncbi:hypothetical protein BU24DRAFT_490592 [Aaosphaeria arxii CBS 175.79]|uniref:Uncharacterized protein n=1 Tax=Aaosphaeria arxii CBS 175.79 TaxID=1450172 RepID=A0A6A5XW74_9PLEO|nr:uncharacterized protein BU24DRAFT_490592 [Aaosphaeria arxii CBS 175.79]KAF2017422.1 hypothetical protein BU24DRAFT_490592 [Aaosphaeria arxii CBS 175.79]
MATSGLPPDMPVEPTLKCNPATGRCSPAPRPTESSETLLGEEPTSTTAPLPTDLALATAISTPVETGSVAPVTTIDAATPSGNAPSSAQSGDTRRGGNGGVSPGAVAGIAIGTAVIGAAIAFLVAFLLFKKRRARESGNGMAMAKYDSNPELVSLSLAKGQGDYSQISPAPPLVAAPAVGQRESVQMANMSNSSDPLAGILPPPADASAVRSSVSSLFEHISRHVDNFYRDVHASITPSMEDDISRFGNSSTPMVDLLQGTSSPTVAIKHALTGYVLAITSPETDDEETLFPKEIASVPTGAGKDRLLETPDLTVPYLLHRRLSSYLHNSTSQHGSQAATSSSIREAAEHFALTFFPWANPGCSDQERDEDLVQIIQSSLDTMIWLYGQPFLYDFMWEGVGSRGIIVSPGLVKLSDGSGRVVREGERGEVLIEPKVVGA